MAKITWTDQALEDLDSICLFIARDSLHYAKLFAIRTFEAAECLELFPELGRVVLEVNREDIREIILGIIELFIVLLPRKSKFLQFIMEQDSLTLSIHHQHITNI